MNGITYIAHKEGDELFHYGVKGQRWGIRRYQNTDGTLTDSGKKRLTRQIRSKIKNSAPGPIDGFKKIAKIEVVKNIDRSKIRSLQQDLEDAKNKVLDDHRSFTSDKKINRQYLEAVNKRWNSDLDSIKGEKDFVQSAKQDLASQYLEALSGKESGKSNEMMHEAWRQYSRENKSVSSHIESLSKAQTEVKKESERIAEAVLGEFGDKKLNVRLNPTSTAKKVLSEVILMYDESSKIAM